MNSHPKYDPDALRDNIARLDREISIFQEEIQKHLEKKAELLLYLREIENEGVGLGASTV